MNFDVNTLLSLLSANNKQGAEPQNASAQNNPMGVIMNLLSSGVLNGFGGNRANSQSSGNTNGNQLSSILPLIMGMMNKGQTTAQATPESADTRPRTDYKDAPKYGNPQYASTQSAKTKDDFEAIGFAGAEINYLLSKLKSRV